MTGTTANDEIRITMEDMNVASINRGSLTKVVYLKVDTALEVYLLSILKRMMGSTNSTDLFAIMHTVIEIAIQAGIDAERRRMHDAIIAAAEMTDPVVD